MAVAVVLASTGLAGAADAANTWTVASLQDDAPPGGTCNSGNVCLTLRDAIYSASDGDTIVFDLTGYDLPAVIKLANAAPLEIDGKSLTIHGPGFDKLGISAQYASQVFLLPDQTAIAPDITIDHLTITAGQAAGANGANGAPGSAPGDAGGDGGNGQTAFGGCIHVGKGNNLHLAFDLVTLCEAVGGRGGGGGNGMPGATGDPGNNSSSTSGSGGAGGAGGDGGSGGAGGNGGDAHGGAIAVYGGLTVDSSTISENYAVGGHAGAGGSGGAGGDGGAGGNAKCALVNGQCLYLVGANGGDGGDGGTGGAGGNGGRGGATMGAGIYANVPITLTNTTLASNYAEGGVPGTPSGGDGGEQGPGGGGGTGGHGASHGNDGTPGVAAAGGSGGNGGSGQGGGIFNWAGTTLLHSTLGLNAVVGTAGGLGRDGSSDGNGGFAGGGGIDSSTPTAHNSIIAANYRFQMADGSHNIDNCGWGDPATLVNDNLSDDASCGFDIQGDAHFAPPRNGHYVYSWGGNGLPVLMPLPGSPAIDGAKVHDSPGSVATGGCAAASDERGLARPYPSGVVVLPCDLGAVESDLIFFDGFETDPAGQEQTR